jgi:hypothetical protein
MEERNSALEQQAQAAVMKEHSPSFVPQQGENNRQVVTTRYLTRGVSVVISLSHRCNAM